MATTITQFDLSPEVLEGKPGTFTISFTTPVIGLGFNDFRAFGLTLGNFTKSADGLTYTMSAVPDPGYEGKVTVEVQSASYFNAVDYSPGSFKIVEWQIVLPVIPAAPVVTAESTGSDDIYNIAEVGPDGTVSVTIYPKENTRVGDTIRVNDTDYDVTDAVLANGLVVQVVPGAVLAVATVTAKNQFSETVHLTVPAADLVAPTAKVVLDPVTANNVIDTAEYGQMVAITGHIDGEYTAGDLVNVTVGARVYQGVVDAAGRFSVQVAGRDLALDGDKTLEAVVVVSDVAGNTAAVQTQARYDVNIDTAAQYLSHLAANLDGNGGVKDANGKTGSNDAYKTSDFNDYIYVGYKGVDANGKLMVSGNDGDFERDWGDKAAVWTLNTQDGNDLVQIREDQNAYTVAKLGAGDDRYYVGGKLDADLSDVARNGNARAYILAESGNDQIVIGGNGDGQVTGWGIDGGRIFTGSGSDSVTVYGEVDDGAVIDVGAGDVTLANGYAEAASADDASAINSVRITRNLGNGASYDFGYVLGAAGRDSVVVEGNVYGTSRIALGDNADSVSVASVYGNSVIDVGTGDNTVNVLGAMYGQSSIVASGSSQNTLFIGGDVDSKSTILTGAGDDTLTIGDDTEDYASINLGSGNNRIIIQDNMEDYSQLGTAEGNDHLHVAGALYNHAVVNLGDGDNTVQLGGIYHEAQLITGAGRDQISLATLNADARHVAVSTGAGDDLITFTGGRMSGMVDGGAGQDTLVLNHATDTKLVSSALNVTNASTENLHGIEVVRLEGNNALDIRYADLVADTSRNGQLLVQGTSSSKVDLGSTNWNSDSTAQASLKDITGGSWSKTGSQSVDGISYDVYHHSAAGTSVLQDVLIQQGLTII